MERTNRIRHKRMFCTLQDKILLTVTLLLFIIGLCMEGCSQPKPIHIHTDVNWLDSAIVHIKQYEGFRSSIYIDTDGSKTIGYGHHLLKGEEFQHITELVADSLLRSDFNKFIQYAKRYHSLPEHQLIAIGLLIYNIGPTRYSRSTLRKLIEQKIDVSGEWIKWRYATINGHKRELRRLYERRLFELMIFQSNGQGADKRRFYQNR